MTPLNPRRRLFTDALVITWVVVWALAGLAAGRALDQVSGVTHSAEGAGAAIVRTGESIRDVDVPVIGPVFRDAGQEVADAGHAAEAQARETRALRALLRDHAEDPALDQLLAIRAVAHLPYDRLRALGAPRADDRVLADAQLTHEGVTRL